MIRAICFDLDNTLFDRDAAFAKHCRDFCARHFSSMNIDRQRQIEQEMIAVDAHGTCTRQAWSQWIVDRFPQLGLTTDDAWNARTTALLDGLQPDDAPRALLDRLRLRYPLLALVSNGSSHNQRTKLRKLQLEAHFAHVSISAEFGVEKPAPAIFHAAAAAMGATAAETLFVGDDPLRDIEGARQAGLQTCWLRRGRTYPSELAPPDYQLARLEDLEKLLAC